MQKDVVAKYDNLRLTDDNKIAFSVITELLDEHGFADTKAEFTIRAISQEIRGKADKLTGIFKSGEIIIEPQVEEDIFEFAVNISAIDNDGASAETQIMVNVSDVIRKLREKIKKLQLQLKKEADEQRRSVYIKGEADHQRILKEAQEKRNQKIIIEKALGYIFRNYTYMKVDWDSFTCDSCDCDECTRAKDSNERYEDDLKEGWETVTNSRNINHELVRQRFLKMVKDKDMDRCKKALRELESAEWFYELLEKIAHTIPVIIFTEFKEIEDHPDAPAVVDIAADKNPDCFFQHIELFEFYPWAEQIALKAALKSPTEALKAFDKYRLQPWAVSVKSAAERAIRVK